MSYLRPATSLGELTQANFDWNRAKVNGRIAYEEIIDVADGVFGVGAEPKVESWARSELKKLDSVVSKKDFRALDTMQQHMRNVVNAALGKKTPKTAVQRAAKEMGHSRLSMYKINGFMNMPLPPPPPPPSQIPAGGSTAEGTAPLVSLGVSPMLVTGVVAGLGALYFLTRKK